MQRLCPGNHVISTKVNISDGDHWHRHIDHVMIESPFHAKKLQTISCSTTLRNSTAELEPPK